MYDTIETVCHDLDLLTINMFELMEEQIKCKMQMEELMKSSCLELAKSRYIMGNHNVSKLQLPTEDSEDVLALKTVASTVETKNNVECTVFKLNTNSENTHKTEIEDGVRERIVTDGDERELCTKPKSENGIVNDPIKWFGFLVPQNLRQAQKGFQNLLELVIESANIQSELEATRKKMNKLRKLKKKFEKDTTT
ncbi:hypothetical protein L9F63_006270, partial [Diploptera punctata]